MKGEVRPGYKQTEVGVIPQDWQSEALANILAIVGGGTPSTSVPEFWDGRIPWVSAGDISRATGRYVLDTMDHISELGLSSCPARILPTGTVVIIARGATTGRMAQLGSDMAFNQTCYGLRAANGLDQDYLYYAMQYSIRSTGVLAYGTIFRTITTQSFEQWRIPLPSTLAEQQAIAEALSDVDALISALDRLIAKKRAIKQGAMQELLRPKDDWLTTKLRNLGTFLKGSGVRKVEALSGDIPCLRYGEIYTQHNDFVRDFSSWISPTIAATARRLKFGDILFAGSGETKEEIGKCIAFVDDIEAYAGGDVIILRQDTANAMFLGYYLNTPPIRSQKASRGQGDAIVHISSAALADIDIALPSSPEQTAIATILSDMDAEIAALERRRDKTKLLKQGMMQELLTGRTRLV